MGFCLGFVSQSGGNFCTLWHAQGGRSGAVFKNRSMHVTCDEPILQIISGPFKNQKAQPEGGVLRLWKGGSMEGDVTQRVCVRLFDLLRALQHVLSMRHAEDHGPMAFARQIFGPVKLRMSASGGILSCVLLSIVARMFGRY